MTQLWYDAASPESGPQQQDTAPPRKHPSRQIATWMRWEDQIFFLSLSEEGKRPRHQTVLRRTVVRKNQLQHPQTYSCC